MNEPGTWKGIKPLQKNQENPKKGFHQESFNQFIVDNGIYGFFQTPVTLKSGRQSHFYVNWRTVTSDVYLTDRVADFICAFVRDREIVVDTFYGVPEGATKVGIISQYKWARQDPAFSRGSHVLAMGRAKPKDHGAPQDRYFVGKPEGRVVVIEDVTTTGGSLYNTLVFLKEAKIEVSAVLSLTNRMEKRDDGRSVADLIQGLGIPFHSMSSALEILPLVIQRQHPDIGIVKAIEAEYATYGVAPLPL